MKNIRNLALAAVATFCFSQVNAQSYKNALGVNIDLGDGTTFVGPQFKHSFDGANAGNVQVLFGDHVTILGADYTYNQKFAGAKGLGWYIGVGPQLAFVDGGDTAVAIRPQLGLEFKIPSAPLAMSFDWKPWWNLTNDSHFTAGRFGIGFKYTLN
ncbi:hypothetical protein AAH994_00350 [Weeksellaceae bacterium A-14]